MVQIRSVLCERFKLQATRSGWLHSRLKLQMVLTPYHKVQSPPLNMVAQPWGGRVVGTCPLETDDGPQGLHAAGVHSPVTQPYTHRDVRSSTQQPHGRAAQRGAMTGTFLKLL